VFGAFVRGVCFEFGTICRAVLFDFGGLFFRELGLRGSLIFRCVELSFFLAFFLFGLFLGEFSFADSVNLSGFVVVEFSAAGESVGLGVVGSFLVLCFHKLGRKSRGLVFAQFDFRARQLDVCRGCKLGSGSFTLGRKRRCGLFRRTIGTRHGFSFGASVGKNPAGKSA
jgi:hypothetical protein